MRLGVFRVNLCIPEVALLGKHVHREQSTQNSWSTVLKREVTPGPSRNGELPSLSRPCLDIFRREYGQPFSGGSIARDPASSAPSSCSPLCGNEARMVKESACRTVRPSRSKISDAPLVRCIPSLSRPVLRLLSQCPGDPETIRPFSPEL